MIADSLSRLPTWYDGMDEDSSPESNSTESINYLLMNRNLMNDYEFSSAHLAHLASVEDSLEADSDALDKMAETGEKSPDYCELVETLKTGLPITALSQDNEARKMGGDEFPDMKLLRTKNDRYLVVIQTLFNRRIFPPMEARIPMIEELHTGGRKADTLVGTLRAHYIWPGMHQ